MPVRSLDDLDQALSWRRLLWWARRRMEVPDRLPYEAAERISPGGPRLRADHVVQTPETVMATKGSGTVRPFVRLAVLDALLYQSLVDQLAPTIEGALEGRDTVFAYRQTLDTAVDHQFDGTPTWTTWNTRARELLEAAPNAYCLKADVSGYFVYVSVEELERSLLVAGAPGAIARDLGELLRVWQMLGIRGLPQGVPSSSPLGNFYLTPLDAAVRAADLEYLRYMDDFWIFTDTFREARRAQDLVERVLYDMGLTLSGEKSTVLRRSTALENSRTAREVVEAHQHLFREGWEAMLAEAYAEEEELPEPHEIETAALLDLYRETKDSLDLGVYPAGFKPLLKNIFRELRAGDRPDLIADVPELLQRFPDLTHDGALYVGYTGRHDVAATSAAFERMLDPGAFHREQELLELLRAALFLPPQTLLPLGPRLAELALTDDHGLVRARALLAWGLHSEQDDFGPADAFWASATPPLRIYPFVAIQAKEEDERDRRYEHWSAEGRFLDLLGQSLRRGPIRWRHM